MCRTCPSWPTYLVTHEGSQHQPSPAATTIGPPTHPPTPLATDLARPFTHLCTQIHSHCLYRVPLRRSDRASARTCRQRAGPGQGGAGRGRQHAGHGRRRHQCHASGSAFAKNGAHKQWMRGHDWSEWGATRRTAVHGISPAKPLPSSGPCHGRRKAVSGWAAVDPPARRHPHQAFAPVFQDCEFPQHRTPTPPLRCCPTRPPPPHTNARTP